MKIEHIGNSRLVYRFFGFLVEDYHMNFTFDEISDTVGVENPTFVYSFFKKILFFLN